MIIEINGQQVEVDDSFADKSEKERGAVIDDISSHMSSSEPDVAKKYGENKASDISNVASGIVGSGVGIVGGAALEKAAKELLPKVAVSSAPKSYNTPVEVGERILASKTPSVAAQAAELGRKVPGASQTENYARMLGQVMPEKVISTIEDMTKGSNPRGLGAYDVAAKDAENLAKIKALGYGDWQLTQRSPGQLQLPPELASESAKNAQQDINNAARLRAQRLAQVESGPSAISQLKKLTLNPIDALKSGNLEVGKVLSEGTAPRLIKWGLRGLGGAAAGASAMDMAQHFGKGEIGRGLVSGLGAVGDIASMTRHPVLMPVGAVVGAGAPFLNMYLEKLAKEHPEYTKMGLAQGGVVLAPHLEHQVKTGQLTHEQAHEIHHFSQPSMTERVYKATGGAIKKFAEGGGAYIGYPQVNKNRKIGSGTGFLDALVGAPASHTSVLNPSDYSYMEGYEKGEPYGIAAMALPFAGTARPVSKAISAGEREANLAKFLEGTHIPNKMYHGTNADFNVFDTNREGLMGKGSWFSKSPMNSHAEGTGANFIPAHLAIKNPKYYEAPLSDKFNKQKLIEQGYDGVIVVHPHTGESISAVAFEPTQIKSSIGNTGTFDPTIPDITKKRGGLV